jgi:hypothetical protein
MNENYYKLAHEFLDLQQKMGVESPVLPQLPRPNENNGISTAQSTPIHYYPNWYDYPNWYPYPEYPYKVWC